MPRTKRHRVSQSAGSYHIISRTVGGTVYFNNSEKEYFLKLLSTLASGFFVQVHAFCIMGNHFHLLVTGLEEEAAQASVDELHRRYRLLYPKYDWPPEGSYDSNGNIIPDEDGGIERLRNRLGSVSRFVQELKQSFSRWYNKKHDRKGYLWSDRFKGVIVSKGEAQLLCSAYIDLNPVRAGIFQRPEDYRWSSLGLRVRSPGKAKKLLTLLFSEGIEKKDSDKEGFLFQFHGKPQDQLAWYREFVYRSAGVKLEGKASIPPEILNEVIKCHGELGIGEKLAYRIRNFSEGIAIGSYSFIAKLQEELNRKFIKPRSLLDYNILFTTRVIHK